MTIGVLALCDNDNRCNCLAYAALFGDNSPSDFGEEFWLLGLLRPLLFSRVVRGELTLRPLLGVFGCFAVFIKIQFEEKCSRFPPSCIISIYVHVCQMFSFGVIYICILLCVYVRIYIYYNMKYYMTTT